MLCFSSSRWPLVVSSGTDGVLPGPLWLCASSGTGWMVLFNGFVIAGLRCLWGPTLLTEGRSCWNRLCLFLHVGQRVRMHGMRELPVVLFCRICENRKQT